MKSPYSRWVRGEDTISLGEDTMRIPGGFRKPVCAECGKELESGKASYEVRRRVYCSGCEPLAKVKESWQPMFSGGSISAVYTLDANGKIVPARR